MKKLTVLLNKARLLLVIAGGLLLTGCGITAVLGDN